MYKKKIVGNVFAFLILFLILTVSISAVSAYCTSNSTLSADDDNSAIQNSGNDEKTFSEIQTQINNANDMM